MNRFSHLLIPFILLLAVTAPTASLPNQDGGLQVVIRVSPEVDEAVVLETIDEYGGVVAKTIPQLDVLVAKIPSSTFDALKKRLVSSSLVKYIEIDIPFSIPPYRVVVAENLGGPSIQATPNDPLYPEQWGLPRIEADKAWDFWTGDPSFIVAVVDTGVDLDHVDLAGNLVAGYDFVGDDPVPDDENGHGSHVAGTIAAVTNNGEGVAGVAPSVKVMPVRVLNRFGFGSSSDVAAGITFAVDNGARVVSLSLGSSTPASVVRDATLYAVENGALVVAAAGNDGGNVKSYPGAFPWVVGVAAIGIGDTRASYSNYGDWVDITAPGGESNDPYTQWILSTYMNNEYAWMAGTSMATPHVSGVAALYWSKMPSLTNLQVAALLIKNADDLPPVGRDPYNGFGRVDAFPPDP